MSNTIDNPFATGDKVRIPAGTVVRTSSSAPDKVITRAQTITVESALPGYTMDMTGTEGHIMLPEVTWRGAGGYWKSAQVTLDVATAHGKTLVVPEPRSARLVLPAIDDASVMWS